MISLIVGFIGIAVALCVWQIGSIFEAIPGEDRLWRDKPAFGFRMVWVFIKFFEHYVAKYYSAQRHAAANFRLTQAGLEYSLSSGQLIGARWVSALGATMICTLFVHVMWKEQSILVFLVAPWGYVYPDLWINRVIDKRRRKMHRDLPFYLDVITMSVEAGANLTGGLTQAVSKASNSPLRHEFNRVLRDIRAGKTRSEALRDMSDRAGSKSFSSVIAGMIQAERSGASLGPVLRAQATQLRRNRFTLAEKKAMEAPVKLLAPLVLFIFPTTFIVLGFLVLSKMVQQQIIGWAPLLWAYSWPG